MAVSNIDLNNYALVSLHLFILLSFANIKDGKCRANIKFQFIWDFNFNSLDFFIFKCTLIKYVNAILVNFRNWNLLGNTFQPLAHGGWSYGPMEDVFFFLAKNNGTENDTL